MGTPATYPGLVIAVRRIVLVAPTHGVALVTLIEGGVLVTIHGLVS